MLKFLVFLAVLIGGYQWGRSYVQRRITNDIALLERRVGEFGAAMTQALSSSSEMSGEEALGMLGTFTHPSGKIACFSHLEFWQMVSSSGTVDSIKPGSYRLTARLFELGPSYWTDREHYVWKFSPNIFKNFTIGYVDASVKFRGVGIASEEVLSQLIELMRQEGKLDDSVFYHGKPTSVDFSMRWVWAKKNWYLDPDGSRALTLAYRPQQRLAGVK